MKITEIKVYQVDLPQKGKPFSWNGGQKVVPVFDSTVVEIFTDAGITGVGEVCPMPYLLASYANGVRAGIREVAPLLIGENPLEVDKIQHVMELELQGHQYSKTAIDIACWDILGKHCGLPCSSLLGGCFGESVELYKTISCDTATVMADNVRKYKKEGFRKFQLKVGGSVQEDVHRILSCRKAADDSDIIVADANTAWLSHEAIQIANMVQDHGVFMEQPCYGYEESLRVRNQSNCPVILDENINSMTDIVRAHTDKAADVIGLKLSKLGGITKFRQCRDVCLQLGFAMKIEDNWGSEITAATLAHVSHSTPEKYRFLVPILHTYNDVQVAFGAPDPVHGRIVSSKEPGLGVTLNYDVIGEPLFTVRSETGVIDTVEK